MKTNKMQATFSVTMIFNTDIFIRFHITKALFTLTYEKNFANIYFCLFCCIIYLFSINFFDIEIN